MKFLNNIEVGESPNFTLPLTDGTSGQVLSTNGTGTVSWVTPSSGSGDLVDVDTNVTDNVIAIYGGSANTIDYASESATSASTNFRIMADGNELSMCNDLWANRASGGVSPKYFLHMNPSGAGTTRSAMYATGAEVVSIKVAQAAAWSTLRNANATTGDIAGYAMRTDASDGDLYIEGRKGSVNAKTFSIESISTSATADRLHVINYGDNHFRLANAVSNQPFMFYWGNGTSWNNVTNEFTTLGVRMDPTSIAVDGTGSATTPNFRFLDDGDTGMYLASTGTIGFASGGSKVLTIPSTTGTNGQVLTADGSGNATWTTPSGATYTAGAGLDLTGSSFSLERDLKVDVDLIGSSTGDYIEFEAGTGGERIDVFVNGSICAAFRNDGAPEFHCDGDIIAYSSTISDARLKEDVQTIENASEKVAALRGVEYTWKRGGRKGQREIGFIAQEVETVVPQVVREKELPLLDGGLDDSSTSYKTVDYEKIIALLVESNKELQARITELESKIK
jgi:hypothetical protein